MTPLSAIGGVLPVINTPFDENDRIDEASLAREIDWVFEQGAQGICAGMMSELLRLTHDERVELAATMVDLAAGRGIVVTSVGAESTEQARAFARGAERAGCDAMMAIPPLSSALSSADVSSYFEALADEVDLALIVQDASAYVGQPIDIEVLAGLLEKYGPEKILFKPEASPLGPNLSALRDRTGGRAHVFEGSGGISLVDSYRRGIAGTMPGVDLLDVIIASRARQRATTQRRTASTSRSARWLPCRCRSDSTASSQSRSTSSSGEGYSTAPGAVRRPAGSSTTRRLARSIGCSRSLASTSSSSSRPSTIADLILLSPIMPSDRGVGPAMRAGVALEALSGRYSIHPELFIFYTIATWTARKSVWNTVWAYLSEFRHDEPVLLIVKTSPMDDTAGWDDGTTLSSVQDIVSEVPDSASVELVTREMSDAEIRGLERRGRLLRLAVPL